MREAMASPSKRPWTVTAKNDDMETDQRSAFDLSEEEQIDNDDYFTLPVSTSPQQDLEYNFRIEYSGKQSSSSFPLNKHSSAYSCTTSEPSQAKSLSGAFPSQASSSKASKKLHDNPGVHESVKEIVRESQSCQSMPEQKTSDFFKDPETTSKNQMHLNLLQELHRKVDWLSINMSRILDELFPDESRFDRPQGFPSLPLNTENDLAEFESYLKNEPIFNNMMKYLGKKGKGETASSFTYSILAVLISNQLARIISWKGTGGVKLSFEKSTTKKLVEYVCLKKFGELPVHVFEDKMKRWFNISMQRS
ncbi:uncharacterized protein LOC109863025 [Pseudomyrmex gracilis]|uniref:uncharacterized protein LOC109863025 n=1 Tax=Pseudomyrmex gracilis TaxID=219809 RepID=UPI000994BC12|nr:uncharacterized protein LOC109863025 [Pseudomyrmex gracilis]